MAPANPTTVRAKFTVSSVEQHSSSVYDPSSDSYVPTVLSNITMQPVYDSDPNSENGRFYAATPSGNLQLFSIRPAAAACLVLGAAYYVDLTRADLPAAVDLAPSDAGLSSANDKVLALVPDAAPAHVDVAIQAFDKVALDGADHDQQKGAAVMAAIGAGATDVQAHAIAAAIPVLMLGTASSTDGAVDQAPAASPSSDAASGT